MISDIYQKEKNKEQEKEQDYNIDKDEAKETPENEANFEKINFDGEALILPLDPKTERFEGFVDFTKFEDIGFFPGCLDIASCSHFLYVTHVTHLTDVTNVTDDKDNQKKSDDKEQKK